MARNLEADLKLCDAADTGAAWLHRDVFANAARTGWRETILELMEARKQIAKLDGYNDSLLAEIAELEEVMVNTRLEAKKKLDEAQKRIEELEAESNYRYQAKEQFWAASEKLKVELITAQNRIAELEAENVGLKEDNKYLREELAASEARLEGYGE